MSNLPPGAQLGRYEIISLLGSGGMGEVYLAQDIKLDRIPLRGDPRFADLVKRMGLPQ